MNTGFTSGDLAYFTRAVLALTPNACLATKRLLGKPMELEKNRSGPNLAGHALAETM